jgi:hypothetical protein
MTTSNVKPFAVAKNTPVPEVVEQLESILAKAKRGEIRAVAFSYVRVGYRTSFGWSGIKDDKHAENAIHAGLHTALTDLATGAVQMSTAVSEEDGDEPET